MSRRPRSKAAQGPSRSLAIMVPLTTRPWNTTEKTGKPAPTHRVHKAPCIIHCYHHLHAQGFL